MEIKHYEEIRYERILYVLYESDELSLFGKTGYVGTFDIKTAATIGRVSSRNLCDIGIDSPIVSRKHGEIAQIDGKFFYVIIYLTITEHIR